jgi:hypothetical protein
MKHLADHRKPTTGTRLREFFRLARDRGEGTWKTVWRRQNPAPTSRRVIEYARIERGETA